MNHLLSTYFPTLLLFTLEDVLCMAGLVFGVIFCGTLFLFVKKHFFSGKKRGMDKEKERDIRRRGIRRFVIFAFFTFGFIGCVEIWHAEIITSKEATSETFALAGSTKKEETGRVLGEAMTQSSGRVLADTTIASDTAIPKSENYHLAFIAVGGDNQMFLENTENKALALSDIGYKTVIDENRENTGAIITWETNKPSKGTVFYRKSSDSDFQSVQEDSFNLEHTIVLEKLGYSVTYVFYVSTQDKWANTRESEKYALYSGSNSPSLFDLLAGAFGDMFGWAMKK